MKVHLREVTPEIVLYVEYEPGPCFQSIRLVGADYGPTGPDLKEFLHNMVALGPPEPGSTMPSGERYLSKIAEEIKHEQ